MGGGRWYSEEELPKDGENRIINKQVPITQGVGERWYPGPGPDHNPVCENPDNMPQHTEYLWMFARLGQYGKESVDDIVIKWLCKFRKMEECIGAGPGYSINGPGPRDMQLTEVNTNKTFLQRFEPIVKNIE